MIKPYLRSIINDYKTQREWKIYLINPNNFDLLKVIKWLAIFSLAWSQQNDQQFFDLLKVSNQPSKKQSIKKQPSKKQL